MHYTRKNTREHCGSTCRDIREGIIRGNGYVANIKYWIYTITSYLHTSHCCNVYVDDNVFVFISEMRVLTLSLVWRSAPASTNNVTIGRWPLQAANHRAVRPTLYVYNNEMMMAIILQSYSQYHLLVLLLLYIVFFCIIYCFILLFRDNL